MKPQDQGKLTLHDQGEVRKVLDRITALAQFLEENPVPVDPSPEDLYRYLAKMKQKRGHTANGESLVACVLAKKYLDARLPMKQYNATKKLQGAKGLDINEFTVASERVVGEIKTTVPCFATDLGANQRKEFEKDFKKLNELQDEHRFFFVTNRHTFNLMKQKYAQEIPGVKIVLLPCGDTFTA